MKFETWIDLQRGYAQSSHHRRLVVISGSRDWGGQQALRLNLKSDTVWLGRHAPASVEQLEGRQASRLLGRSLPLLIIDCWDGFNPNALGQASGALCGGGLLVLICPPLASWADFDDPEHGAMAVEPFSTADVGRRFIRRFTQLVNRDPWALIVREEGGVSRPREPPPTVRIEKLNGDGVRVPTQDQMKVVSAVLHAARNRRQPLVITADRGRGKSAAMGMAAAEMLRNGKCVIVTAPRYLAAREVFEFAAIQFPDAHHERGLLRWRDSELRFFEPDQLLQAELKPHMVLVDEAAAIPAPILSLILDRYNRVVFSTTVHGYEGTGRGFAVRFRQELERRTPRWRTVSMRQPVRWAEGDPLEALVFDSLMLDADAASDESVKAVASVSPTIDQLDRDRLVSDPSLLRQLFGLLVLAHYRTTPGDLRVLLDSPNLRVWCVQADGVVLACALVADEGPLPPELAQAIWAGTRRPPGHLLPQTLVAQAGFPEAADLLCARVMRIAVHPAAQRQRLGERLLSAIMDDASLRGLDYMGASFAASAELLPFWQQSDFQPVRLGQSRDAVSGSYAVVVVRALSSRGSGLFCRLRQRYAEQIPVQIGSQMEGLDIALVPALLKGIDLPVPLNEQDMRDLKGFAYFSRSLDSTKFALRKLVLQLCSDGLFPQDVEHQRLLMEQLTDYVRPDSNPAGQKWLVQRLRDVVACCLDKIS